MTAAVTAIMACLTSAIASCSLAPALLSRSSAVLPWEAEIVKSTAGGAASAGPAAHEGRQRVEGVRPSSGCRRCEQDGALDLTGDGQLL